MDFETVVDVGLSGDPFAGKPVAITIWWNRGIFLIDVARGAARANFLKQALWEKAFGSR